MNADETLQNYLKDYWEFKLKHNPSFATYIGDHRYDGLLEDLSEESYSQQAAYFGSLSARVNEIEKTGLNPEGRLNQELIHRSLENHIRLFSFRTHYLPIDQMSGPHIDFPQLIEFHPFKTGADFKNYIARLNAFPGQVEQVIENLQKGIHRKMTAYRRNIEMAVKQVEAFTKFTLEQNPLYSPVSKMKEGFPEKEEISAAVKESISQNVTPAYVKLYHFLNTEYIIQCREKEGMWALPDGADMYRFFVQYHTTTDLSPEEIHQIGRDEVERIRAEIKRIMLKLSFSGSIRGFANSLKERKEVFFRNRQEILDEYRKILSQMDIKLPEFFGSLPRASYDIKEIEKYREQAAPAAYYYPPPDDFSRPGYFYANTYQPEHRPKFITEALSYHEAVPGHHLQIAIMQELKDLPDFRRYEGSTAFIEGWALYAEKLAKEMGFYQDDLSEYGRLNFEIWRAVRLVVDTGIHFLKWTRDEAIQYCMENSGEAEHEIGVEVDRYIAMPGQALAYKIGELKILELRQKAMSSFGTKFDVKKFHDIILEHGALPLNALERVVDEWTGH